jgi:O-methyltransferase
VRGVISRTAVTPLPRQRRSVPISSPRLGLKRRANAVLYKATGYQLINRGRSRALPDHYDDAAKRIIAAVRPRTLTSHEKIHALVLAIRYLLDRGIPGAIVECGVWRGGSMQAVAHTLSDRGVTDRDLHLFDTFEGMTEPTDEDRFWDGRLAADVLNSSPRTARVWAVAGIDDVQQGMAETGYPTERIHYHVGRVEETIPAQAPETIALLRLDTDWYESTRHELEHLYSRVPPGGVVIADDYSTFTGARKAVDEFLESIGEQLLLLPISQGRIAVKPG